MVNDRNAVSGNGYRFLLTPLPPKGGIRAFGSKYHAIFKITLKNDFP
jgi:hypothetical protein